MPNNLGELPLNMPKTIQHEHSSALDCIKIKTNCTILLDDRSTILKDGIIFCPKFHSN